MNTQDSVAVNEAVRKISNSSQEPLDVEDEDFGQLTTEEVPSDSEDVLEGKEPGDIVSLNQSICPTVTSLSSRMLP